MSFSLYNRRHYLITSVIMGILVPIMVEAGSSSDSSGTFTLSNPLEVDSVAGLVQNFTEIFSYVAVILAVILLIWVGLRFVTSRGDVAKMKELKEWLFWIVVGTAVIIGARVIINVVIQTLSSTGTVDQRTLNSVNNALNAK